MVDPRLLRALDAHRRQTLSRKTFHGTVKEVMLYDPTWLNRKRIIICCDGTSSDETEATKLTNVALIHRAVKSVGDDGVVQKVHYIEGCGTGHNWWINLNNARTGSEMPDKILQAYLAICSDYQSSNDAIYLVGFSRGAHVAKCVARFINDFGVLRKPQGITTNEHAARIKPYFDLWLLKLLKTQVDQQDLQIEVNVRDKPLLIQDARIRACALFDTVDTMLNSFPFSTKSLLFNPNPLLDAIDSRVCENIDHAIQALALNEHRDLFRPVSWYRDDFEKRGRGRELRQCWFYGCHLHVGGGGEGDHISIIPLMWMASQLYNLGLDFDFVKLTKDNQATAPPREPKSKPMPRRFSSVYSFVSDAGRKLMAIPAELIDSANDWKYLLWSAAPRTPGKRFAKDRNGVFHELANKTECSNETIHWTVRYFDKKKVLPKSPLPPGSYYHQQDDGSWAWYFPEPNSDIKPTAIPEALYSSSEVMLLHQAYAAIYRSKRAASLEAKGEIQEDEPPQATRKQQQREKQDSIVRHIISALDPVVKEIQQGTRETIKQVVTEKVNKKVERRKERTKQRGKEKKARDKVEVRWHFVEAV